MQRSASDRARRGRAWRLALVVGFATTAVVGTIATGKGRAQGPPLVLLNVTRSQPLGLYLRARAQQPEVGRLVAFAPPSAARTYEALTGSRLHSFLKPVAAVAGTAVCTEERRLRIGGQVVATIAQADRQRRALPHWLGCRRLRPGEVFVYSARIPNSFDSRYFGPVPVQSLMGVYRPILTPGAL